MSRSKRTQRANGPLWGESIKAVQSYCNVKNNCIFIFGITSRLTGTMEDGQSPVPDACFIRAPPGAAEVLSCEIADALSCLMVTGAEELVSRVIRVKVQGRANFHFPVTLVVPFSARYRGNYRDVAVKIMDEERRGASYVTPATTEGTYGGQRVKSCFECYLLI